MHALNRFKIQEHMPYDLVQKTGAEKFLRNSFGLFSKFSLCSGIFYWADKAATAKENVRISPDFNI